MNGLGLALGGGGIIGCCHIGVICALEEAGVPIHYIAGTSAGAMVAALYASGYSGKDMAGMVPEWKKKLLDYDYVGMIWGLFVRDKPFSGLIKGDRLRKYLEKTIGDRRMGDMRLPLAITSTDLGKANQVLFTNKTLETALFGKNIEVVPGGKAVDAVMASMAMPGLFRPVTYGGRMLVDGGLMDNCPTAAVKAMGAAKVLGVNLVSAEPVRNSRWSFTAILFRSLSLGLNRMSSRDACYADLLLHPDVGAVGLLDFSSISLCVERGYDYTVRRMGEILKLAEEADASIRLPAPLHLDNGWTDAELF